MLSKATKVLALVVEAEQSTSQDRKAQHPRLGRCLKGRDTLSRVRSWEKVMPRWRALTDLTLPDGVYIQAGTSFDAPLEWHPPTNAVQPLDPDATESYWQEGPRGMSDAEPYRARFTNCARWSDVPVFSTDDLLGTVR